MPPVYGYFAGGPPTVLLELPIGEGDQRYMYFSISHWQPLVNGYSAFFPASYVAMLDALHRFPDDRAMEYLRTRGVQYVIVHGAFYRHDRYARLIERVDKRGDLRLVGNFPWRGAGTRLYRVLKGSEGVRNPPGGLHGGRGP